MENTVKESWKRRVTAALMALFVLPALLLAAWQTRRFVGASLAEVLELDRSRVESIRVVNIYDKSCTLTDKAVVEDVLDYFCGFRYSDSFYIPPRSGWTYRMLFCDANGDILLDCYPSDDAVGLCGPNGGLMSYWGRDAYFAPFIDLVRV